MDRHFAAVEYAKSFRARQDWRAQLLASEGRLLSCTCATDRLCHGDVLVHLFHGLRRDEQIQGFR